MASFGVNPVSPEASKSWFLRKICPSSTGSKSTSHNHCAEVLVGSFREMETIVAASWPELPYAAGRDTCSTLQLWTQIVGKVRLSLTPWINHSWHVTLRVTARGLGTPLTSVDGLHFQVEFDFINHILWLRSSDGHRRQMMLKPMPVAEFYSEFLHLSESGIEVR